MQKVSKQSLAMLALSILLAISIALTFTFAAFSAADKTATGTITFTGSLAITLAPGEGQGTNAVNGVKITNGTGEGNIVVEFTNNAFKFDGTNFVLTADAIAELAKATVKVTNSNNSAYTLTVTKGEEAGDNLMVLANASVKSSNGAAINMNLDDFISEITLTDSVSSAAFTITFSVAYDTAA